MTTAQPMSDLVLQADRFQGTPDELRAGMGLGPAVTCPRHTGAKLWAVKGGGSMACLVKVDRDHFCTHAVAIDPVQVAAAR